MNEDPDEFWPWRTLEIDEDEWQINRALNPPDRTGPWWHLLGAVLALLLIIVMS